MLDVTGDFEPRERRQVIADGDALAELAQAPVVQLVSQLRLAEEDDLQELALVGLEIREQADLLQKLGAQILGLVDEQDDVLAGGELVEEEPVERLQTLHPVVLGRNPELREDSS